MPVPDFRPLIATACVVLLTGCAGAPSGTGAPSPELPTLVPGEVVEGALRDSTPTFAERGRFQLYRFQATEGELYVISMESSNFDPYLVVGHRPHGIFDVLAVDDDGGEGTNARLRFIPPRTGPFLLVAQALGADEVGLYTLQLDALGPPTAAEAVALTFGEPAWGELTFEDPVITDDPALPNYDLYTFDAEARQRYVVSVESDVLDPYLDVGPLQGTELEVTWSDDDGGEGTNSRLFFVAPESGTYGARVRSFSGGTGGYTIQAMALPDPGPIEPQPLSLDEPVSGELEITDPVLDDGSFYDLYTFQGQAGQVVNISVESDDFDTFLNLGRMETGELMVLVSDDDGGTDTNSMVEYTLPEDGDYHVRVESYSGGQTGSYRLVVRAGEQEG